MVAVEVEAELGKKTSEYYGWVVAGLVNPVSWYIQVISAQLN